MVVPLYNVPDCCLDLRGEHDDIGIKNGIMRAPSLVPLFS